MRFRVLGPLRVWDGAAWVAVRAGQQRVVLATLLAEAGRVVSTGRLVEEVWGDQPPRQAARTVQGYVFQLRRLLGGGRGGVLATRDGGYELTVAADDVDAYLFEQLVAAGRQGMAEGRLDEAVRRLSAGLELWHGAALADVPAGRRVSAHVAWLEQLRLAALEDRLEAQLGLGRHADVADELQRLVGEYPLRERLHGQLMLALYRCGRRAEALQAYGRARVVLVAELGLEPGPRLREVQQSILADDREPVTPQPTAAQPSGGCPVTAAMLPADVADFTGRDTYLERLDELTADGHGPAPVLVVVSGTAGVGKTALVVRWAKRVRARFPDGQLYVDLRGYSPGSPLHPVEALARLLPAIGGPVPEIPAEVEDAVALYRSVLADKRVLIVLDNAHHPDQIRPLMPGGSGCVVVTTSRDQLRGLHARDAAAQVTLDRFTPGEAHTLLTHMIGARRMSAEPQAAVELASLCGFLPLALRVAAANLASQPRVSVADHAARLAGDRLAALQVDGDPRANVRAAFDHSYAALPADVGRLFRLLGLVRGPDITATAAAALADTTVPEAGRLLDRLAAAHLVDEAAAGRYSCHDLLRWYAAETAAARDDRAGRLAALDRLFDHYLHGVDVAAGHLYPQMLRLPVPAPAAVARVRLDDHAAASAWLDAERPNLVAAVVHASAIGRYPAAWRLADALRGYLYAGRHTAAWQQVAPVALAAAEADGDPQAIASAHLGVAMLSYLEYRYQPAIDHYTRALAFAEAAGWVEGESGALGNLGVVYLLLGRLPQSADYLARALAIDERTGWVAGQATKLANLGAVSYLLGRLALAVEYLGRALALHRRLGRPDGQARNLTHLGAALHALGRLDDAVARLGEALTLHRVVGDRGGEVDTLRLLASTHRDLGGYATALDLADTATALARDIGDHRCEADALNAAAGVHHHLRQPDLAIAAFQRARELARSVGDRPTEVEALIGLADAHRTIGDTAEAAKFARAGIAIAGDDGYRSLEGAALTVLAATCARQGDHEHAIAHAERALAIHEETGHRIGQARTHVLLQHLHGRAGTQIQAQAHDHRARDLFAETGASHAEHARILLRAVPTARGSA